MIQRKKLPVNLATSDPRSPQSPPMTYYYVLIPEPAFIKYMTSTIQSKMAEAVPDEDVTLPRGLWCNSEIFSILSLFNAFLRSISLFSFYLAFFSHKLELFSG